MENLTVVVPFWNGHATIERLLDSVPDGIPVLIVDDKSDEPCQVDRQGVKVIRLGTRGYFSGAVNAGLSLCKTDALVLNQDVWFTAERWLERLAKLRETYAVFGDGVLKHPAWPKGYVQGTLMFMRRDAVDEVGGLDELEYPLWGATCEWQLRACRAGFEAHVSREWRQWMGHEGRHGESGDGQRTGRKPRYGGAITQALGEEPGKRRLFLRTPPAVSVIVPCFNYGRYLEDAVNSLLGGPTSLGDWEPQTLQSFEVIIVDDASTDDSWQAAQALADPWKAVRAIRLPENRGTPGAINAGIEQAYGEYIHILSADDMREPWGLEVLYDACKIDHNAVAYGDVRIFKHGAKGRRLKLPNYDFDLVLNKNPMPAGIMYPRKAWIVVGGYPEAMIYGREDWAFNIGLGAQGYCGQHIGLSGNLYRREGQNRSLRTGNVHRGETGKTNGFSWRKTFKEQLQALYPDLYAGERPVTCCGGRKKAQRPRPGAIAGAGARPGMMAMAPQEGWVWLEYVGGNAGNSYWGPVETGRRYMFGGGKKTGRVKAADAKGLLAIRKNTRPQFRKMRVIAMPAVPKAAAVAANPPAPDDLTELKGIGAKTAQRLEDAGFTTYLELGRTKPERIAALAEVSLRMATTAHDRARDVANA